MIQPQDSVHDSKTLKLLCREIDKEKEPALEDEYTRIPQYKHTRIVTVQEIGFDDGKKRTVVSCSCGHFITRRCLCRHIYSTFDMHPKTEHFYPDCFKLYEVEYGEDGNDEFSSHCDVLINLYDTFRGLVFDCSLDEMSKSLSTNRTYDDLEFYQVRLNTICDVNPLNAELRRNSSFTNASALRNKQPTSNKRRRLNSYSNNLKDYSLMTSLVTNEDEDKFVRELIHQGIQGLLSKKSTTNKLPGTTSSKSGSLCTFPNMETKMKIGRLKPMGSPTKYM